MAASYDVVVIGAGPGGYVAAIRAAQLGKKVAVVEKQKALGGTCLIWGCIPTKALLEHAHALEVIQNAGEWGVSMPSGAPAIDMRQVHARKDKVVAGLTRGIEFLFRKNKIDWVKGTARLAGGGRVEVVEGERQTLEAADVILATGSAARSVPGIEIDRRRIITSDEAIHLPGVPSSLVILGSGAVGVEFASIYRRFGSDVTIVELLPRLVPLEDEAISAELEKSFRKQGIKVLTGTRVTRAFVEGDLVRLAAETPDGKTQSLAGDILLVATGRGPVTSGLGAEELGIRMDKGYIRVDSLYRTSVPNIAAIGDVITVDGAAHPQLAHVSSAEAVLVAERLAGREVRPLDYDHVPSCTYCDPEIGSVGLTEAEARARGHDVRVGSFPFGVLGRAKMAGETEGFVRIVADTRYDEVLGVHMIGPRSTELIAEAVLALRLECTVEDLVRTIHAHPTFSEAIGEAAHALHGAAIHL
ncbi:MAG: dihydrolipoyl dehydrogenase [Acidobacteria bacterium RIFCSPLOWO2_02_FULL_68_18]|nr:MAG: dihydrolipoyl dehydrogenase [Acidobacteria bacterium RIFCSPLOWO2_02_FULL_68_18]OFW50770.1 MAG: dihydrolipoyl dehydrogenase [Acidobacteria bacterium RIFCSPLOWO2_12_FULL_68_19]